MGKEKRILQNWIVEVQSVSNTTNTNLLQAILESSPNIIIFALDTEYNYIAFNQEHTKVMYTIWGKEINLGMNMLEIIVQEDDRQKAKTLFDRALGGESFVDESEYGDKALSRKFWQTYYSPIYDDVEKKVIGLTCYNLDISERKQTEEKLKLLASVFSSAKEGIVITDISGTIVDVNEAYMHITGYSRDEIIGKNAGFLKSDKHDKAFFKHMWGELIRNLYWIGEIWNRRKNGEIFVERLTISAISNSEGKISSYVGLLSDITTGKDYESTLERMAFYDSLTGLPNRLLLAERINQAMTISKRLKTIMAVCYLDLDGFKPINDSFGHGIGDTLLAEIADRMQKCVRESDTVARIGGDEFAILLLNLKSSEECENLINKILKSINDPYIIKNIVSVKVSASIGITLYPQDDCDSDMLLRHADQAMYIAKESGKNQYIFHS